jgi:mono/diheme cytochrome c family protein
VLAGQAVALPEVDAVGCLIDFPERDRRAAHAQISYAERIAPLLVAHCASCHRPGGIGPWSMTSYEVVRGFAPMVREVVRTKRMPPWHADPHYGSFVGDRSLTIEEARTLVHWIEAGAPRGTGPDPLRLQTAASPEWSLGTPDLVVEVPAFAVPATGVVDYQYPRAPNPLGRDVWIRAVEIIPGDRAVVHHVLAGIDDPANGSQRRIRGQIGELGGYAPGKNMMRYPEGTGILLRKEAGFRFQMHYTPNGKATTDVTRVGYYFTETPPKYPLRMTMLMDTSLSIPAHAKVHTETLEHVFDRDVILYSLMPHAHLRGRAAKFTAHYPDGRAEVLLSVPKYDFGWQTTYMLSAPKPMRAGTRLAFEMTWDNSAQNPANPDPTRTVRWGEQTWDEMNVGWLRYRYADESAEDTATTRAADDERTAAASAGAGLGIAPTPRP